MKLVIYRFTLKKGHSTDCPGLIYVYLCPSFSLVRYDTSRYDIINIVSQLLYSFWRVGIIMSKLKNKLCIPLINIYI